MPASMMQTRDAGPADIDALIRLINAAFAVERFIYDGDRTDARECADLLRTGRVLLAEAAASPIGCIYLELREHCGYFGLLSVAPPHQGRGIGRRLVSAAEDWFRANGRTMSELQIINVRPELADFYRRLGYRAAGTSPFPADVATHVPCHFVRMAKSL
jgi:GNAT superfamily N-acetyltransferase